ncbi:MAG TPA: metal-dependent hydrolase [Sphingomicrobium sp.]|nr:metal-dependent hydrolase [Sphingomicrobium sp.]
MDNITHSLAGWALGQAGLKTRTRKGLAVLILGANMPDIDVFFGWVGWEPLAMHRGFTHSLVSGMIVMPPVLVALLWLLDRWQIRRGAIFKSGLAMRPAWLLALAYLAALTHPLFDLLTTYSVQLLSPFSQAWFHADGLFIIDVWIWLLLSGAITWSRLREKRGQAWQKPVQAAIGILLGYISLNLVISQRAYAAVRDWTGDRPAEAIFASPPPFKFWRRGLVWREANCYRWSPYDPLAARFGPVTACRPHRMRDPLVSEALKRDSELRDFLRWSVLPLAEVERSQCSAKVSIGDARYQDFGSRSRLRHETLVPTRGVGC